MYLGRYVALSGFISSGERLIQHGVLSCVLPHRAIPFRRLNSTFKSRKSSCCRGRIDAQRKGTNMKQQFVNDAPNNVMAAASSTSVPPENAATRTVDYQLVSSSTQQQIKLLASSNACLRRNLVRFSHGLKQVGQLAYHDALTGLPNRSLLLDRLHQAMQQAIRQQKIVLLLFVDLDDFKWVNDNLGVAVGDNLLMQVAQRLATSIRGADTACRYGGDEFVLMLPEIDSKQNAAAAVQKIRTQLAVPYVIDDRMITLRASIGVILYRGGEQSCEDLLQQADSNMHQNRARIISPTISVL